MHDFKAKLSILVVVTVLALAGDAAAQSGSETYDVAFESVTSNCDADAALSLTRGRLVLERDSKQVKLRLAGLPVSLPELRGSQRRGGKLKAKATGTGSGGRRQRLTASGRVEDGTIQLLFIAELHGSDGKSVCSQTWDVTGKRAATTPRSALRSPFAAGSYSTR